MGVLTDRDDLFVVGCEAVAEHCSGDGHKGPAHLSAHQGLAAAQIADGPRVVALHGGDFQAQDATGARGKEKAKGVRSASYPAPQSSLHRASSVITAVTEIVRVESVIGGGKKQRRHLPSAAAVQKADAWTGTVGGQCGA